MVKPEYSAKRDLTYSQWHRTLPSYCCVTNIDWVEVRNYDKIVAIIEDKDDRAKGINKWQSTILAKVASALNVPLYVVFHNCSYKPQAEWKFTVLKMLGKDIPPQIMNLDSYTKFITNLK